jgi:hypothetical protein
VTAIPPPAPVAWFESNVLFWTVRVPVAKLSPPPVVPARLPKKVESWTSRVPVTLADRPPPRADPATFWAKVAFLITRVLAVNPAGGVALAVPVQNRPPPLVAAEFPDRTVFSRTRPPPLPM